MISDGTSDWSAGGPRRLPGAVVDVGRIGGGGAAGRQAEQAARLGAGDEFVLVGRHLHHAAGFGALQGDLTGVAGGADGGVRDVQGAQPLFVGR